MELRWFKTKSKFNKWFQKGKFRHWNRLRFGQLVIEARRIGEERVSFIERNLYEALSLACYHNLITIEEVKQ